MSSPSKIHIGIALTIIIAGCNDPATKQPPTPCYDAVPGEMCDDTGETGSEMGETGENGETGGESGATALGAGECVFNLDQHKIGKQYNCFGELHTSLDLAISGLFPTCEDLLDDDDGCSADFYFDYEPQVVACCGDYDIALKSNFQVFCIYDLYEQVCRSLAHQLEYQVEQGHFGIYGNKGAELQQYVADNVEACFNAFSANNIAPVPFVETYWALPKKFGLLEDIVVHIEPNTRIDGVNNPLSGDEWLTCESAAYNNDTFFGTTGTQQPQGGIVAGVDLADPVNAELSGPVVFGGAVSASVEFGTSCSVLGCPKAEFSYDAEGPVFGLEQLTLIGGSFEITNGTDSLTADRVQVRLYAQAAGMQVQDPESGVLAYEIPPGEAVFTVAGIAGDTANRFMAANATSIWVVREERENHDLWQIDAFVLEYEDGNHGQWTATIGASTWR